MVIWKMIQWHNDSFEPAERLSTNRYTTWRYGGMIKWHNDTQRPKRVKGSLYFQLYKVKYKGFSLKKVFGCNFWMECPTDLRSTFLSCIFNVLFRDTPLGHVIFCICAYGHKAIWPYLAMLPYGHMRKTWPSWISQVYRTLHSEVTAKNFFTS